jgi:DNA-binding CsgD family transcriptional regulator
MKEERFYSIKKYFGLYENIENCNKNHLEYNKKISSTINDICKPLSNFGITMFTYSRIFNGGRRLYMCSNQQWVEHYITQEFQDEIDHLAHYVPVDGVRYALWEGFKRDKVFDGLYNHNMGNGFSIYEKNKEYVDYFDFASHKDNNQMVNLYMNNLHLLLRFIEYFKEKIFLMVDFKDKKNFLLPKKFVSFNEIPRGETFKIKGRDVFSNYNLAGKEARCQNEAFNLTNRELRCLRLLSEGKTTKEVSQSLSISPKTVESYIQMAKMKFEAVTKEELITFYKRNLNPQKLHPI